MKDIIISFASAFGIGSAVTGMVVWFIKRQIDKRAKLKEEQLKIKEEQADKKERELMDFRWMQMKLISAAVILSEATAVAVQRIPDAHCNGDMHKALESTEKLKSELDTFMSKRGFNNLFDD